MVEKKRTRATQPSKAPRAEKAAPELGIPIYDVKGKEIDRAELDKKIFTGTVNKGVLYNAVVMYNANKRQGNASTKTITEVSGGGKKPWRQKGTGRARAGSIRSPLWRGGGVVFGPHPRDYRYQMPKKAKHEAFISSINVKLNEKKIKGIDVIEMKEPKTKYFKEIMDSLKITDSALFILDDITNNIKRSSRNIPNVDVRHYRDCSTMDILLHNTIVISKKAIAGLEERVRKS